jgi:Arc/MetJ-type ribon-helix-helix transcriptional regulator
MAKETVRYPDALVARIEAFVTDSTAFESKSEYHRFASEFLLSLLDPDHEPSVLGYGEIFDDLGAELDDALDRTDGDEERFLETYIRVRRHLLHGELDEARATVDEAYDVTDREALLLDELIGQSQRTGAEPSHSPVGRRAVGPEPRASTNGRSREAEANGTTASETEPVETDTAAVDETTVESEH